MIELPVVNRQSLFEKTGKGYRVVCNMCNKWVPDCHKEIISIWDILYYQQTEIARFGEVKSVIHERLDICADCDRTGMWRQFYNDVAKLVFVSRHGWKKRTLK